MSKLLNKNVEKLCESKDGVMSLYAVGDANAQGKKPIIFLRGHAGKYTVNTKKILDNAPNNYKLVKQHEGFYYDDEIHFPIIAEYSYKDNMEKHLRQYQKDELTTQRFSDSVMELIEKQNLNEVDIVGASVGANVGMLCSKSDKVDRVSVVSPTMPYSYLADINAVTDAKNKSLLDRAVYLVSKLYLDQGYGFVSDMDKAFRNPEEMKNIIDPNKIFIQAGAVTHTMSKNVINKIMEYGIVTSAKIITKRTGLPSDGAVVTDASYYDKLGVKYNVSDDDYHVYCDQAEYVLKRAYKNLNKIR